MTATEEFVGGIIDTPEDDYHADPVPAGSLSVTEAKRLLDCPARYYYHKHYADHSAVFDFGKAAHAHVLGVGAPVDIIEADDWRTKAAKEARDESREAGRVPLLTKDWEHVEAMALQLRRHPLTAALLDPDRGQAEQSAFWFDRIWRRCRFDWLPDVDPNKRLIIPDYKTAPRADARSFGRSAANFGYHQQAAWYLDGARHTLDVAEPAFVFVCQEKTEPYLVNVVELDPYAIEIGAALNERAVDIWVEARESGEWPGYGTEVEQVALPRWAEIAFEEGAYE